MMVSFTEIRASGRWVAVIGLALGGCTQEDDEFTFGRADMEDAALGTWTGVWEPTDGTPTELTLELRPPDAPPREAACASREFSGSTPGQRLRCDISSMLSVSATLTLADGSMEPLTLDGWFDVWGTDLDGGVLDLNYAMPPFGINVQWTRGGWQECKAQEMSGALVASCSLDARE